MINLYRKLPVTIEAVLFDGSLESAKEITEWVAGHGGEAAFYCTEKKCDKVHNLHIKTLEGNMIARADWYIIRGLAGEFYPCKGDVFRASYERVVNL